MDWNLPLTVNIDGIEHEIDNKCDYRVVLNCIGFYEDIDLDLQTQHQAAFMTFYKEPLKIQNVEEAVKKMLRIIDNETEEEKQNKNVSAEQNRPRLMRWENDFKYIVGQVNAQLGYDIRDPNKYTHWHTFLSAFYEIKPDCLWGNIISIRSKRAKGKKLEKYEQEFYQENKKIIDLPIQMSEEEKAWLDEDW